MNTNTNFAESFHRKGNSFALQKAIQPVRVPIKLQQRMAIAALRFDVPLAIELKHRLKDELTYYLAEKSTEANGALDVMMQLAAVKASPRMELLEIDFNFKQTYEQICDLNGRAVKFWLLENGVMQAILGDRNDRRAFHFRPFAGGGGVRHYFHNDLYRGAAEGKLTILQVFEAAQAQPQEQIPEKPAG